MKLAIMQPYLFPYIGYFQLINAVDTFVILDDVQWIKRGWINRNRILSHNQPKTITLSINQQSNTKMIHQLTIVNEENRQTFLNKIIEAYRGAPFFRSTVETISPIVLNPEQNIVKYIRYSLEKLMNCLEIDTKMIRSSDIQQQSELKGQDKIINLCQTLHARTYINPIGGQKLYEKKAFSALDISLQFVKNKNLAYDQNSDQFIPDLSIIDVMMFNSTKRIKEMLCEFELL